MDLVGTVLAGDEPLGGAVVVVSDEGEVVASGRTDDTGTFALSVGPGRYTVRAFHPDRGGGRAVVDAGEPFVVAVSPAGCWGYVDLPDPAVLTDEAFRATWDAPPLERPCAGCTTYRWFWARDGLAPAVLRLDWSADGLRSVVRTRRDAGWTETASVVAPRRAHRLEQALIRSGYWELEHLDTRGACRAAGDPGSEWTVEAWASPGYRAVYRTDPGGTPLAGLGWAWTRAAGWRVRRRDLR